MRKLHRYLICFVFLLASCNYKCDEFPQNLLTWIPFRVGDTILYQSDLDIYSMEVVDFFKSGESSERGLWMDYECNSQARFETRCKSLGFGYKYIFYEWQVVDLIFSNNQGNFIINVQGISDSTTYYKTIFKDSIMINEAKYQDIYITEKDTTRSEQDIWKVIVNEDFGLIQFETRNKKKYTLRK